MKRTLLLAFAIWPVLVSAQSPAKKIQIVLLGSFHFNQSLDSASRLHSDLFSPKRQAEVDDITSKLARYKPTKIFIEQEPVRQAFWDSVYTEYKHGKEPVKTKTRANEIFQLGIKTAKKINLDRLTCVDFQPENYDAAGFKTAYPIEQTVKTLWDQISKYKDSVRTNAVFFDRRYPFKRPKQDSLLQRSTLAQFLINTNTTESYTYFNWSDWFYFYSLGRQDEYLGTDWLANFWYGRNLRIFSNIMRQVDMQKDERYLVIYGASHMPFIKHLFETNPFFEVVELDKILK